MIDAKYYRDRQMRDSLGVVHRVRANDSITCCEKVAARWLGVGALFEPRDSDTRYANVTSDDVTCLLCLSAPEPPP